VTDFRANWVKNKFMPLLEQETSDISHVIESLQRQIELIEDLKSNEKSMTKVKRTDEQEISELKDRLERARKLADQLINSDHEPVPEKLTQIIEELERAKELAKEIDENQSIELQEAEDESEVIAKIREQQDKFEELEEIVQHDEFSQLHRMEEAVRSTEEELDADSEVGQAFSQAVSRIENQNASVINMKKTFESYESKLRNELDEVKRRRENQVSTDNEERHQLEAEIEISEKIKSELRKLRQQTSVSEELSERINAAIGEITDLEELLEESDKLKKKETGVESSSSSS
jgi:DNA repair exonuclease SbcCD ATPase subunit